MRILVMGCGRLGAAVAVQLLQEGHQVRIMDTSPESFLRIPPEHRNKISFQGDGANEEDLEQAGAREADVFIAASTRDTHNALAAQMARHVFGVKRAICRMNDPVRQAMYCELGLDAISPQKYLADSVLEAVRK